MMSLQEQVLLNLADGVTVQNRDFNIIYQNHAMQRFFGSHIGEKCYEVYEQRCTVCQGCGLEAAFRTGQSMLILRTAFEANGTTSFWENSCSPVSDESGHVVYCAEVCRNVSARVSLEEAFKATNIKLGQLASQLERRVIDRTAELARANRYLDEIIDSIADPLFVKDRLYRWVLVNRAMCDFLGHSRGELLGRSDFDLFPESEARVFRAFDELVLETGRENINEEEVTTAGAGTRTIVTKKTCFSDPSGEKCIVGIVRDITERKRLEEQLRQSQKMESIGLLAGGIAHDFNNLLTVIQGYADLTEAGFPVGSPLRENVSQIKTAAGRAISLTAQLLAFSRKQVLQPQVIGLNKIVQGMEKMLSRLVGEDVRLQTFLPPEVGNIMADPGQVEQVMMNLAANARDAMPNGGRLTVETANRLLDEVYVHEHPDVVPGQYVMLAMSDTGEGMDRETLSRIFEPFFTTKERGRGTGLGLATVYGIVKQSGGSVFCYSEKGAGTSFSVYFPRVCDDKTVETPRAAGAKSLLGTETVLLVEDEKAIRSLVVIALRNAGYAVREAQDGPEAIAEASSGTGPIHLLLTDVVMPRLNGPEVARRIQEIHPDARILYMSGYTENSIVRKGILDADFDLIQKPFNAGRLLEKVREVLDR
jgi:two-component system cell cycle sensor histidine kinase/response regulator CckA